MADNIPKAFVLVLMPLAEEDNGIYEEGIKPAVEKAGAYVERVEEQLYQEGIVQKIYNRIDKADVVVADMTGRSADVFYEVGFGHALGKHVILLARSGDDIPSDLRHYHILYEGENPGWRAELEKRIRWAIENPKELGPRQHPVVQFYINGTSLADNPTVIFNPGNYYAITLKIGINNPDDREIQTARFKMALITSKRFSDSRIERSYVKVIPLPQGGVIHLPDEKFAIFPGAWEALAMSLITGKNPDFGAGDEEDITLRVFTEAGWRDYPFKVKINAEEKKGN